MRCCPKRQLIEQHLACPEAPWVPFIGSNPHAELDGMAKCGFIIAELVS
jgi:hypothetical protein